MSNLATVSNQSNLTQLTRLSSASCISSHHGDFALYMAYYSSIFRYANQVAKKIIIIIIIFVD